MNRITAKKLAALNTQFYKANAASFSQTRQAPWQGWRQCVDACSFVSRTVSVLDIACGNLRFESFLACEYSAVDWRFFAIDNCEPLVDSSDRAIAQNVNFTRADVVGKLFDDATLAQPAQALSPAGCALFDLVVSFGFMHHIPGTDARARFLREALNRVKVGGYLAVSFWQFLNDNALREKAVRAHTEALEFFSDEVVEETLLHQSERQEERADFAALVKHKQLMLCPADFEEGDYLLGWKNLPGQYRYCHHFSDEEIDHLIVQLAPQAKVVSSFSADGKTGSLNRYLVFCRVS